MIKKKWEIWDNIEKEMRRVKMGILMLKGVVV